MLPQWDAIDDECTLFWQSSAIFGCVLPQSATTRTMVVSLNALLLVGVPLPSIAVSFASQTWCTRHHDEIPWCSVYQHPLLALNILFFFNVTVLFWVISLCQGGSTWLIDPYWTILPILIHMFYATHAHAPHPTTARQLIIPLILLLWSVRLTHSYFRREHWRLGARQDWRFETMRQQWGPVRWRWASFWVAYASQHVLLVGLTLPLHAVVLQGGQPTAWTLLDTMAAALALLGSTSCMVVACDHAYDHAVLCQHTAAAAAGEVVLLQDRCCSQALPLQRWPTRSCTALYRPTNAHARLASHQGSSSTLVLCPCTLCDVNMVHIPIDTST